MRRLLVISGILFITGTWAVPERAPAQMELPGMAPATYVYGDRMLRGAVAVADIWWSRRGVAMVCQGGDEDVYVYNGGSEVAQAERPGCRVAFNRRYRDHLWKTVRSSKHPLDVRVMELAKLLTVARHERAHNYLGLPDVNQPGSIMHWQVTTSGVPPEFKKLAAAFLKRLYE